MSAKFDKRRANRIQGGWARATESKKNSIIDKTPNAFEIDNGISSDIVPKYDNHIYRNPIPNYRLIENSADASLDLNELYNSVFPNKAQIELRNGFISEGEAVNLCDYFLRNLPWEQRQNATPKGETFLEPRMTCWYGLPYSYSKVNMPPNTNWDPKLHELLLRVQKCLPDRKFNSVMCNLYTGCKNSIDWHADDEKSLGSCPTIASISLGCTRAFELCRRSDYFDNDRRKGRTSYRPPKGDAPFDGCSFLYRLFLSSGSLLTMSGSVQDHWLHRVPKEYHDMQPRINFTFRYIVPDNSQ